MFRIKVTDIFKITGRGQLICGEATELHYKGSLVCEGKVFTVLGSPVFENDLKNASYLLDTFELDDSFIGKEFIENERDN